jgi:WhiB family transcriptional regulator, redox-sensing transcriptional regulator
MAWTRSSSGRCGAPAPNGTVDGGPSPTGSEMSEGSVKTLARRATELAGPVPCRSGDSWLWFAQNPDDLEEAKARCRQCPLRVACLAGAAERREPCGVWGGEIFDQGAIVAAKRRRGRPYADRRMAARAG